jgi:hypothetical protein
MATKIQFLGFPYAMYMPPFTGNVTPVIYAALGLAKNATAAAISAG